MIRYIILFSGVLGLFAYGEEGRKNPRKAGQEIVDPLLRARAESPVPDSEKEWEVLKNEWMGRIKEECFSGWPNRARADDSKEVFRVEMDGMAFRCVEYSSMGFALFFLAEYGSIIAMSILTVLIFLGG